MIRRAAWAGSARTLASTPHDRARLLHWLDGSYGQRVPVHYAEYGSGTPVLALHGAGVDHREISGALEPIFSSVPGVRRLYPDLPGMGRTPAAGTITSNDDVLDILLGFIDSTIGDEPFFVIGHSYGGFLARAIANRRADQAVGLALICPVGAHTRDIPQHEVLVSSAGCHGRVHRPVGVGRALPSR
ncbi:alpha/beta fold hydrolase [Burkholderia sp. LFS038]|uniref:alpha/beta fold hydrolase n=1 Tax=Burkholderia sp. LFS038 TaxID=3229884 RepID=UPI003A7FAE8A